MLRCSHQQWVLYGLVVAATVAPTAAGTEARRACAGMGGDPNGDCPPALHLLLAEIVVT